MARRSHCVRARTAKRGPVERSFLELALQRMWPRTEVRGLYGCWLWQGAWRGGNQRHDTGGPYGVVRIQNQLYYVHRIGAAIHTMEWPEHAAHLCMVRRCWNPLHVHPSTARENLRDAGRVAIASTRAKQARELCEEFAAWRRGLPSPEPGVVSEERSTHPEGPEAEAFDVMTLSDATGGIF